MTTALAQYNGYTTFDARQVAIIKDQIAKGASDDELAYFLEVCKLTGLNPLQKQIYAIMRNQSEQDERGGWRTVKRMTIQTGIDGYRLLAARTHELAGIDDALFDTEDGDHPGRASVTVYRMVGHQRVSFTATARYREYVQTGKDGKPTAMWARMPWLLLAKCAEALALRKAFPAELSGLYTADEMAQADSPEPTPARMVDAPVEYTPSVHHTPAKTVPPSTIAALNDMATKAHAQFSAPTPSASPASPADDLSIGEFVREAAKLGMNSKQLAERLGVPQAQFHTLHRRAEIEKLQRLKENAGVVEEQSSAHETEMSAHDSHDSEDGIEFVEEDHSQDAPYGKEAALADGEINRLFTVARVRNITAKEAFLAAQFGDREYTRDQVIAALEVAIEASGRTPDLHTLPAKAVH